MSEEMLTLDTPPEVEAETTQDTETAETEAKTTGEVAEEAKPAAESEANAEATADTNADDGAAEADADAEEAEPPVVRVKFNKQERTYTTDEAAPLVEMGLKWESFKESHEKLKDLAAVYGVTVGDLINNLTQNADEALYKQTLEECDGNEVLAKKLFAANKADRDRKIQSAREDETKREQQEREEEQGKLSRRLADGFLELQKETGKFKEFKDVPEKVVMDSVKSGRSLYDSYLRFEKNESKKTESVKLKQAEAAKTSSGSLSDGSDATPEVGSDFSKALMGAF